MIEIKDGEVFVDGKKVADAKQDSELKIIKDLNGVDIDVEGRPHIMKKFQYKMPINKAMLGVSTRESKEGVEVVDVVSLSAAEKGGIEDGDVITAVDHIKIETPKDLVDAIAKYEPGDKVQIGLKRAGDLINKEVELGENQARFGMMDRGELPEGFNFEPFFKEFGNLDFDYLLDETKSGPRLGIGVEESADGNGLMIKDVAPGSLADKSGLEANDMLLQYGQEPVHTLDELERAIHENKDREKVNISILRNGTHQNITIEKPKVKRRRNF